MEIYVNANSRAYDRAALKFRGLDADINFNVSDYEDLNEVLVTDLFMLFLYFFVPEVLLIFLT